MVVVSFGALSLPPHLRNPVTGVTLAGYRSKLSAQRQVLAPLKNGESHYLPHGGRP